jgi:hypothetical protein
MRANLLAVILSLASLSLAADCSLSQPRKEGDPTGQQIAKAIGTQTELDRICSGQWRTGDEKRLENSFNHWGTYVRDEENNGHKLIYKRGHLQSIQDGQQKRP